MSDIYLTKEIRMVLNNIYTFDIRYLLIIEFTILTNILIHTSKLITICHFIFQVGK